MAVRAGKNPDILKRLGELKRDQILVGFAAETTDLLHYATKKLQQKMQIS